ncbi:MAG: DUF1993 domain-containing protein [Bosea sp.]|jgi:hypothetical protein|nr:DUF1993 domain-containing protein [Bosea sp. (in: a-proteobacteria)]
MSLSLHAASVPVLIHSLTALAAILTKAEAHATAQRIDPNALLQARLYPDMLPLVRQVQITCDMAKAGASRLAQMEVPSHPDTETTFPELQARVQKVIDLLKGIPASAIDGGEDRIVTIKVAGNEMSFTGADYLVRWVNPNFFFHLTTSYALLRHNGLPIGKRDYLGSA